MNGFNPDTYISVNERVQSFWNEYRDTGRIETEVTHLDGPDVKNRMVVMQARVFVNDRLMAVGHAKEREGLFGANKTAFIENCETSAVGRALANFGMMIEKSIASREEMQSVKDGMDEMADLLTKIKQFALESGDDDIQNHVKKHWSELRNSDVLTVHTFYIDLLSRAEPEVED